jgi:hypothetical protein
MIRACADYVVQRRFMPVHYYPTSMHTHTNTNKQISLQLDSPHMDTYTPHGPHISPLPCSVQATARFAIGHTRSSSGDQAAGRDTGRHKCARSAPGLRIYARHVSWIYNSVTPLLCSKCNSVHVCKYVPCTVRIASF